MSPSANAVSEPDNRSAYAAGIGCYVLWGFLPLYFHLLSSLGVGSWEMIAHTGRCGRCCGRAGWC